MPPPEKIIFTAEGLFNKSTLLMQFTLRHGLVSQNDLAIIILNRKLPKSRYGATLYCSSSRYIEKLVGIKWQFTASRTVISDLRSH